MDIFQKHIVRTISKVVGKKIDNALLEVPPNPEMGDYAFPCFTLSKKLKKSPNEIAQDIGKNIELNKYIREVKIIGPYINFFVNKKTLAEIVLKEIFSKKSKYGSAKKKKFQSNDRIARP